MKKGQMNTVPDYENYKTYTLEYLMEQSQNSREYQPGGIEIYHDTFMGKWRMSVQLDEERVWFMSVFINEDDTIDKFYLDEEVAADSHYEFKGEAEIREKLYQKGDEERFLHEIFLSFMKNHSGDQLLKLLRPYITFQWCFD